MSDVDTKVYELTMKVARHEGLLQAIQEERHRASAKTADRIVDSVERLAAAHERLAIAVERLATAAESLGKEKER